MPRTDNQRFSSMIEPHLEALFRAAWRLTRNRSDAEDLVQETCIRACERMEEFGDAGHAKAWLLRVMHNRFIDGARRARISPIDAHADAGDPAVACASPTPEELLDTRQRLAQLERAWQRLDRNQQALLALRAEGYTLPEISRITNIATDALTMRLYRARQNLTCCLQQERAPSSTVLMEAVK